MAGQVRWFPSFVLLVVALATLTQGRFTQEDNLLHKVGETLKTVGDKINSTVRTGLNSIFQPIVFPTDITTTTEAPVTEEFDVISRQFIDAPPRCPPKHSFVAGRCRAII